MTQPNITSLKNGLLGKKENNFTGRNSQKLNTLANKYP